MRRVQRGEVTDEREEAGYGEGTAVAEDDSRGGSERVVGAGVLPAAEAERGAVLLVAAPVEGDPAISWNAAPKWDSKAFNIYSAACWQWKPITSSLTLSDAMTASSKASALRRKSKACSRRLIEYLPPCGGFVMNVAGSLPPVLKLLVADAQ